MTTFVLLHSPIVGPATWAPVASELAARGLRALVPDLGKDWAATPYWERHVQRAVRPIHNIGPAEAVVLVAHSGAGPLLPAIGVASGRHVAGYLFVDAGLPDDTQTRKGAGSFAEVLDDLYARGRRFPEWTETDFRYLVPDDERRHALLADLRPAPRAFWDEIVPVFDGWPDAPCAYLAFVPNDAYASALGEARGRGWRHRAIEGSHFHMLVDPRGVADALIGLAREMGLLAEP
jgi:hypothetical protein